jgi:transcriptional regulator with XRE-family HTH domain
MAVSQKDIAEYLGMDRSTVTKVLNRDPRYSASEKTRDLIFRTAERLGYDFTAIRRPYKREYGRVEVNAKAEIALHADGDELFDQGEATVRNLSIGGALLTDIRTGKMVLPLRPFSIRLRIRDVAQLADLDGDCELVRISEAGARGEPQLGVRFMNVKLRDRRRIREFVEEKIRQERASAGLVADPESFLAESRKRPAGAAQPAGAEDASPAEKQQQ